MDNEDFKETSGTCPSQEQLERYAFGKADASLSRLVEEHMTSCELCSDVVDGLLLAGEKDFRNTVFRVNAATSEKTQNEPKRFFFSSSFLRIAAGVFLAFSTGYFLIWKFGQNDYKVAQNIRSSELQNSESDAPLNEEQSAGDMTLNRDSSYEKQANMIAEQQEGERPLDARIAETIPNDEASPEKSIVQTNLTDNTKINGEKMADDVPTLASEDVALPDMSETLEQVRPSITVSETPASTTLAEGETAKRNKRREPRSSAKTPSYEAKKQEGSYPKLHARVPLQFFKDQDWQSAYDFGKDLMHLEPSNDTAIYIAAVSALRLGKQSECMSLLSQLSEMKTATFHRPAELQRALQLIDNESKKDAAKKLLKSLSLGTDSIAKRAGSYLR